MLLFLARVMSLNSTFQPKQPNWGKNGALACMAWWVSQLFTQRFVEHVISITRTHTYTHSRMHTRESDNCVISFYVRNRRSPCLISISPRSVAVKGIWAWGLILPLRWLSTPGMKVFHSGCALFSIIIWNSISETKNFLIILNFAVLKRIFQEQILWMISSEFISNSFRSFYFHFIAHFRGGGL